MKKEGRGKIRTGVVWKGLGELRFPYVVGRVAVVVGIFRPFYGGYNHCNSALSVFGEREAALHCAAVSQTCACFALFLPFESDMASIRYYSNTSTGIIITCHASVFPGDPLLGRLDAHKSHSS